MLRVAFFYAFLSLSCGYAWRRGGSPERWTAAVLAGGTLATLAIIISRGFHAPYYRGVEVGFAVVDVILLGALLLIALSADRFWPLWLTALHAFTVVGHVSKAVAPDILPNVYLTAAALTVYPGLLLLLAATYLHTRRLAEAGRDPSWSASSLASIRRWRGSGPIG